MACKSLFILALVFCVAGCGSQVTPGASPDRQQVVVHGSTFQLELALTDQARYQGLSDRKSIPTDGGMLFAFSEPQRLSFVMRKCLVPIDLIYLEPNGRIDSLYEMHLQPYNTPEDKLQLYNSLWPVQFAIELRHGSIRRLHLQPGQMIDLPLASLKQRAR